MFFVTKRHMALTLFAVFVAGILLGSAFRPMTSDAISGHQHRDIYQLYRIDPEAPLSVVFRGACIEAEDSAAHVILREYGDGVAVFGCKRVGY